MVTGSRHWRWWWTRRWPKRRRRSSWWRSPEFRNRSTSMRCSKRSKKVKFLCVWKRWENSKSWIIRYPKFEFSKVKVWVWWCLGDLTWRLIILRQVEFFLLSLFSGVFPLWKNKFKTIILLVNFSFKRMALNWTKQKSSNSKKEITVISIKIKLFF